MTHPSADVVICGAGIAGIVTAYHLTVKHGLKNVVLVDERPPLTLTSDKSTECYRNWWPGPGNAMVSLMNRSIDLLEELAHESGNIFRLNRRGYLYATADPARIPLFKRVAEEAAELGAGPARYHTGQPGEPDYVPAPAEGYEDQPTGADILLDPTLIRRHFPYLSERTIAVVHARRCGWFSGQQLGMYLLEQAQAHGARLVRARLEAVDTSGGRVQGVRLSSSSGSTILSTHHFVNAAGPFINPVAQMVGVDLPIFHELHVKIACNDHLGAVPRHAPLVIWTDPVYLPWSEEERELLAESDETRWLLDEFPAGVHARPDGPADSSIVLILWTYDTRPVEPTFPFKVDLYYPEIAFRGLAAMLPSLSAYFDRMPKPILDGGYYTKTRENRLLAGPLPVEGAYLIGAFSGYGLMAACGAGELLAAHLTGSEVPPYAPAFRLERYQDPAYQQLLEKWGETGQL
jgi:glycine/D-amino acid oxidase-like deaminating enzyme